MYFMVAIMGPTELHASLLADLLIDFEFETMDVFVEVGAESRLIRLLVARNAAWTNRRSISIRTTSTKEYEICLRLLAWIK